MENMFIRKEFQTQVYDFIDLYIAFIKLFLSMRLVGRNVQVRRSEPQAVITPFDKDYNSFVPEERANRLHFAKRETCPTIYSHPQHSFPGRLQDRQTTIRGSSKVGSTNKKESQFNEQCKILTLQQIKSVNEPRLVDSRNDSRRKSSRKLFVSISKSNRSSESRQSKSKVEPKLSQIGGDFTLLRSLSNRKKIVEKVEIQMHENYERRNFLCG